MALPIFFCLLDIPEYLERFAIPGGGLVVEGVEIVVALVILVALGFIDALVI